MRPDTYFASYRYVTRHVCVRDTRAGPRSLSGKSDKTSERMWRVRLARRGRRDQGPFLRYLAVAETSQCSFTNKRGTIRNANRPGRALEARGKVTGACHPCHHPPEGLFLGRTKRLSFANAVDDFNANAVPAQAKHLEGNDRHVSTASMRDAMRGVSPPLPGRESPHSGASETSSFFARLVKSKFRNSLFYRRFFHSYNFWT